MPTPRARPGHAPGTIDASPLTATPPGHGFGGSAEPASRSIIDVVNNIFARFDVDGDATITLSEWLGVRGDDASRTALADDYTNLLLQIDSNGDGALGTDEITAAFTAMDSDLDGHLDRSERLPARAEDNTVISLDLLLPTLRGEGGRDRDGDTVRPTPAPISVGDAVAAVFNAFDTDGSSTIAVSELLAALDHVGRHGAGSDSEARVTAWIARVNSDADGSLSHAEVTAAATLLDADHDGKLTTAEAGPDCAPGGNIDLIAVLLHHIEMSPAG